MAGSQGESACPAGAVRCRSPARRRGGGADFTQPGEVLYSEMLAASAEADRLAGAPEQAAADLRAALRIYEDARAMPLAERTRATLASLAAHPGREPA